MTQAKIQQNGITIYSKDLEGFGFQSNSPNLATKIIL